MGDRISISFKNGDSESVALFDHWGGEGLKAEVKQYAAMLKTLTKSEGPGMPLYRREPGTVMLDFTKFLLGRRLKHSERVESCYYLGKDKNDGDNSDNGHWVYNLETWAWEGGQPMSAKTLSAEYRIESAITPREPTADPRRVVLHESARDGELVVHYQNTVTMEYYWGHYFTGDEQKAAAIECYLDRCAHLNVEPLAGLTPHFRDYLRDKGVWIKGLRELCN